MHPGLRDTASLRRSVEHSKMKEARIALKCEASEVGKIWHTTNCPNSKTQLGLATERHMYLQQLTCNLYKVVAGFQTIAFVNMEDWKEFSSVYTYVVNKTYADGTTKDEKRRVREKAQAFVVENGVLFEKNANNVICRVLIDENEKKTLILSSLHADDVMLRYAIFMQLTPFHIKI